MSVSGVWVSEADYPRISAHAERGPHARRGVAGERAVQPVAPGAQAADPGRGLARPGLADAARGAVAADAAQLEVVPVLALHDELDDRRAARQRRARQREVPLPRLD